MLRSAHARAGIVTVLLTWGTVSGSPGEAAATSADAVIPGPHRAPRIPRPRSPQPGPKRQERFRRPAEDGEEEHDDADPGQPPHPPNDPHDAKAFVTAADADQAVLDACAPPDAGE